MAGAPLRGLGCYLRHPSRPHASSGQAGRGAGSARTLAAAHRAAPDRTRWETLPLPAPDGSGALVVALDLRTHEAVAEHSDGRTERVPLTPDRPVREVTRDVLAAVRGLAGPVEINPRPQETPWTTPLDEDDEHATYAPGHVTAYFAAATRAALVLSALRAPYRGRSTPGSAPGRARFRPVGGPAWVRGLRLGSGVVRQHRGSSPPIA